MNANTAGAIDYLRSVGYIYTFDGNAVADFIAKLDNVVEIVNVDIVGARLAIYITALKEAKIDDVLSLIPMATLLEVAASSFEKKQDHYLLWFEWILPKPIAKGEAMA